MKRESEPHKEPDATVLEYVRAATSASGRSRAVVIVMITGSVLVFTVIWNTGGWRKDGGWLDARIRMREAAYKYFNPAFNPNGPDASEEERESDARVKKYMNVAGIDPANQNYQTRQHNEAELAEDIKDFRRMRNERVRIINMPFFGVSFDMDDMSLYAGLTFAIVTLWLMFSLARERRNQQLTFDIAEERGQLKTCYDLLSMQQVLTVPPKPNQKYRWLLKAVPKFLYCIPLIVYLFQLYTDWQTLDLIRIMRPDYVGFIVTCNILLLIGIALFTLKCVLLSVDIDKAWWWAFLAAYPSAEAQNETPVDSPPGTEGEGPTHA